MPVTLYLVRSCQTRFDLHNRVEGSSDSRLTKLGVKQAKALRKYFLDRGIHFSKAYCSTQERASTTLEIIINHRMSYHRIQDIRERDYGFYEARNKIWLPLHNLPTFPQFEDQRSVVERMERGMNLILRDVQPGDQVLVVGHSDSLILYLKKVIGMKKPHVIHNGALVQLRGDGQHFNVVQQYWPAENIFF